MRQGNSVVVRTFLAAAALAACVWAGSCPAQAAPGSIFGAQPSPQNAWGEDGVAQLPGDAGSPSPAAKLREQALAAMEALREEIATLTALRDVQAALLAWNRQSPWYLENTETGFRQQWLSAELCSEPAIGAWCPLLPATFGTGQGPGYPATENKHDRD